jgi:hypothetical protein
MNLKFLFYCLIIIVISIKCTKKDELRYLKGSWMINELYHNGNNLTLKEGDLVNESYLLFFTKYDKMLVNIDSDEIQSDYAFYKFNDVINLEIKNSELTLFNGLYKVKVDTISSRKKFFVFKLTATSKSTKFVAHKSYSPD